MTKQRQRALKVLAELWADESLTDFVNAKQANQICANYGVTNSKYARIDQTKSYPLSEIAVEISKKETKK